jgi:hypothetical protein
VEDLEEAVAEEAATLLAEEDAGVARTTLAQARQVRKACVKPLEQMLLIVARRRLQTKCELRA